MKPHPSEFSSRESRALWLACRDDRAAKVRQGRRIAWILAAVAIGAACVARADTRPALWQETSGSMAPAIGSRDLLVPDYCSVRDLRPGDIVTFRTPLCRLPVTHRLLWQVRGWPGYWITKGDANAAEDRGTVSAANFICRIGFVIHRP